MCHIFSIWLGLSGHPLLRWLNSPKDIFKETCVPITEAFVTTPDTTLLEVSILKADLNSLNS